jgi:hypothetical protein
MEVRVQTLSEISTLINMGKWKDAQRELAIKGTAGNDTLSAHYWVMRSLVARLLGGDEEADRYIDQARRCDDWSDTLDGDSRRDVVLAICRKLAIQGRWRKDQQLALLAHQQIAIAQKLFGNDENRQASLLMTRARLAYSLDRYAEAVWLHKQAAEKWGSVPGADVQWIRNNRFHWLKASRCTVRFSDVLRQDNKVRGPLLEILGDILGDPGELNKKRKLAAIAIFLAGHPACSLYDRLATA